MELSAPRRPWSSPPFSSSTTSRACSTRWRPSSPPSSASCARRAAAGARLLPERRGGRDRHRLPHAGHDRRRAPAPEPGAPAGRRCASCSPLTPTSTASWTRSTPGASTTSCRSRGIPTSCSWWCAGRPSATSWRSENARLRDELELALNALRREAAEVRERPLAFEGLIGAADRAARRSRRSRARCSTPTPRCCSWARPARARSCSRGSSTTTAAAAQAGRSSPRTAARCPSRSWSPSSSATCGAPSRAPPASARACSRRPTAARSSSTRSARLSPAMQLRLLRVLQEGEIRRVGGGRASARSTCA